MAEPNSKRVRMDNLSQESSSSSSFQSRKVDVHPKEKIIITDTQEFEVIRNMPGFVDHTHFIGSFLRQGTRKLAIFAPHRFGKSTHLNMVKKFLEIDVDKETGEVSSTVDGPPEGRKNFPIFAGTRIITDDKYKNVVQEHLGKHPVIHLDFKAGNKHCSEEATMHCREVVHNAYLEHKYLTTSKKLEPSSQNICKKWCDNEHYKKQNLSDSLYNLTRYLYNHFNNAKVYILVDEFDSVNANALRGIRGNNMKDTVWKLEDICSTLAGMLSSVTKTSDPWIGGALITGVLCVMASLGYSHPLNNFTKMKFLEGDKVLPSDQDFVPFYGATKNEVMGLIQKLVKDKCLVKFEQKEEFLNSDHELDVDKIMADVQSRYDGYFDREGTRIFCLWSVLQYLETADPRNYWNQTDGVENLHHIFKCETIAYETMNLIRGEEIMFTRHNIIRVEDFVKLHDLMQNASENKVTPGMVFNFLIDLGYLSYPEGGSQGRKFKLPNAEIRTALSLMIGDVVQNFWKIATISCTRLIEDISLSTVKDEKLLQSMMLDVHKTICETLRQLKENKPTYMNEARMLCIMNTILNDVKSFELTVDLPIRDAEGRSITSDRSDFLLLHKHDQKFSMLWELKYKEDGTKDEYTTSLYALQEARGIAATRNGKTKNCMDLLKKLGREALVVGLSVDNDNKVSLSYSSGMEEKIFSISEREHILYPDFYKTYSPVLLLKKESGD